MNQHITCEIDGTFMIVTLNRPDKLNAYTGVMGAELDATPSSAPTPTTTCAPSSSPARAARSAPGADVSGGADAVSTRRGKHGAGVFATGRRAPARRRLRRCDLQLPQAVDRRDQRRRRSASASP